MLAVRSINQAGCCIRGRAENLCFIRLHILTARRAQISKLVRGPIGDYRDTVVMQQMTVIAVVVITVLAATNEPLAQSKTAVNE